MISRHGNKTATDGGPRRRLASERGAVSSWLILAAALCAAAVGASTILHATITQLAGAVGIAAGVDVALVDSGGLPVGAAAAPAEPGALGPGARRNRVIIGAGDPLPPVTGPPVLDPPLPENDETENLLFPGGHVYTHLSPPTTIDFGTLMDAINERGVHPNQTEPFVPGEPYEGDVDIEGPFDVDNVTTTAIFDENGNQVGVRNETAENHPLHPGWVERTVVQDENGGYRIQTNGGGEGWLGGPNVWFDELVWGSVDALVLDGLPQNSDPVPNPGGGDRPTPSGGSGTTDSGGGGEVEVNSSPVTTGGSSDSDRTDGIDNDAGSGGGGLNDGSDGIDNDAGRDTTESNTGGSGTTESNTGGSGTTDSNTGGSGTTDSNTGGSDGSGSDGVDNDAGGGGGGQNDGSDGEQNEGGGSDGSGSDGVDNDAGGGGTDGGGGQNDGSDGDGDDGDDGDDDVGIA